MSDGACHNGISARSAPASKRQADPCGHETVASFVDPGAGQIGAVVAVDDNESCAADICHVK
jgi:hypothetical protein